MRSNELMAKFIDTLNRLNDRGIYIPGLIMSSPGAGKTSSLELYAKTRDMNLVTLIASQYGQDDILGIQSVQTKTNRIPYDFEKKIDDIQKYAIEEMGKGTPMEDIMKGVAKIRSKVYEEVPVESKLVRLTPSWYNHLEEVAKNGKKTILFIDEITTCDEFIQAPLLNLIFSKSLGDKKLPDNVFIVSAGNYSEELNGAFSITAPMVNRFMILNLSRDDYSFNEVLSGVFDKLEEKDYEKFLGLEKVNTTIFDFDKIKNWIKNNVKLSDSDITNNRKEGLLGFCTIRSLSYSLKFTEEYISNYNDNDWMRIVGDTLGKYDSGEDKLPIRNKLISDKLKLMKDSVTNANKRVKFLDMVDEFSKQYDEFIQGKRNYEPSVNELKQCLDPDKLTENDIRVFTAVFKRFPKDSVPGKLLSEFVNISIK